MLTYEKQLKQMSNEELIEQVLFWRDTICDKRDQSKAELLFRLNRNSMDENCGNCEWSEKLSPNASSISCCNEESKLNRIIVNSTIRCMFWEGGKE